MPWSNPKQSHDFWGVFCETAGHTHTHLNVWARALNSFLSSLPLFFLPLSCSPIFLLLSPPSSLPCLCPLILSFPVEQMTHVCACGISYRSPWWSKDNLFGFSPSTLLRRGHFAVCLSEYQASYLWASWILRSSPAISPRKHWEYRHVLTHPALYGSRGMNWSPCTCTASPSPTEACLPSTSFPFTVIGSSWRCLPHKVLLLFFLHLLEWKEILVPRPLRPL